MAEVVDVCHADLVMSKSSLLNQLTLLSLRDRNTVSFLIDTRCITDNRIIFTQDTVSGRKKSKEKIF